MKINPEMIVLSRKMRGMTQAELSRAIGQGQARISKLEGGVNTDVSDALLDMLCNALNVPVEFLTQEEELISFGSSAFHYRKKSDLSASDRDKIHAVVNLYRIYLKRLLPSVEIEARRVLPAFDVSEDFGGSAQKAAQALRSFWMLPDGPIRNITSIIESAGIIVIPCEFGTRSMDATAIRITEMPPMIFINKDIPVDRWRFTLAHELGHLVMHDTPNPNMEEEADCFAAEFLMPEIEIRTQFQCISSIRLEHLATLKPYWRVSMAALLVRASDLGFINPVQKSRLWARMSQLGWRTKEPSPIPKEQPTTLKKIMEYFEGYLEYSIDDFQKLFRVHKDDFKQLYDVVFGYERPILRAV